MPFVGFMGPNFWLMHVNANLNVVRLYYLLLWDYLKKKVRARKLPPANNNQLVDAVIGEWKNISQDSIENLIVTMPRSVNGVSRSKGGPVRY